MSFTLLFNSSSIVKKDLTEAAVYRYFIKKLLSFLKFIGKQLRQNRFIEKVRDQRRGTFFLNRLYYKCFSCELYKKF